MTPDGLSVAKESDVVYEIGGTLIGCLYPACAIRSDSPMMQIIDFGLAVLSAVHRRRHYYRRLGAGVECGSDPGDVARHHRGDAGRAAEQQFPAKMLMSSATVSNK
jgi:hypothetical protein